MRRSRVILTVVVLVAIGFGCAMLETIKRPEIRAGRPRIAGISFQGMDMEFDVDVNNPYPIPIKTPQFRYGLDIEGAEFINSAANAKLDLPAARVGTVTLPVRLSYADLLKTFSNLADAAETPYKLHGALVFSALEQSFELPLEHSGTIPVLRPPTLSNVDVGVSDVSLRSAKLAGDAVIKNPNVFALGIKDLGYVLELGKARIGGLTASTDETIGSGQSGKVQLSGVVSATDALSQILKGQLGAAKISFAGSVETPYGPVKLGR